jgi:hypothetical protein
MIQPLPLKSQRGFVSSNRDRTGSFLAIIFPRVFAAPDGRDTQSNRDIVRRIKWIGCAKFLGNLRMLTDAGRKKPTAQIVTKAQLAELFSVSRAAVSQWVRRRKLTAPALRPDGRIDVERARAQLAETIGYGRAPSPAAAAARSGGADENAVATRLARSRADLLSVKADERAFDQAVADDCQRRRENASASRSKNASRAQAFSGHAKLSFPV